jgi:signal transduction histidine kinase
LTIIEVDKKLEFTVTDNGKGLDPALQNVRANAGTSGRNGLKNMRARAEDIHATLNIHSKINEGVEIKLFVTV